MKLINGASTSSRNPQRMLTDMKAVRARGQRVMLQDSLWYTDWQMGLAGSLGGYAPTWWNEAIRGAVRYGTTSSITHEFTDTAADLLSDFYPDFSNFGIRWMCNGSDACGAAAKIARAVTGRESIISYGYHGWHSTFATPPERQVRPGTNEIDMRGGCLQAEKDAYIPLEWLGELYEPDFRRSAAVFIETPPHNAEPEEAIPWLHALADIAHKHSCLVILDEVVTGIRYQSSGATGYYQLGDKVDLVCFGKTIGNGFPVSALVGKMEYMDKLRAGTHASGTFFGNPIGLAAVVATLSHFEEQPPWGYIHALGNQLKAEWNELDIPWKLIGHPTRPIIDPESDMNGYDDLRRHLFREGIIVVDHPWFTTTAHTQADITALVQGVKGWLAKRRW